MATRILIVEDEKGLREEIADWLMFESYEVSTAGDGSQAVAMIREKAPDLVLSDIMMPEMTGIQLLHALKSDKSSTHIPFIFTSALSERHHIRKGMEMGADDYLSKPFTRLELLRAVESVLNKRKQQDDLAEQKLNDLKKHIIAILPHELRTPLNSIIGFGGLLAEMADSYTYPEIAQMGESILSSGVRLHRLVENHLLYVQIEFLEKKPVGSVDQDQLHIALESEKRQMELKYNRENAIDFRLQDACLDITSLFFKKVIQELVDNALKFSDEGSSVRIRGEIIDQYYVLTITNTGEGMTQEQTENFGAFVQFGRQYKEQQGIGFGVALVRKIMELFSGSLNYQTNTLNELTAVVSIPLCPQDNY